MKGWFLPPAKGGLGFFYFSQDENNNLILHYTDDEIYPSLSLTNDGNIIIEYDSWYPNIMIDQDLNILTDDEKLSLDEHYNLIYELDSTTELSDMFFIDDNGNLIYEYETNSMDIIKDKYGNILLNII